METKTDRVNEDKELSAESLLSPRPAQECCTSCDIRIRKQDRSRYARIQPLGFWASVVTVSQSKSWDTDLWGEIEIGWSTGGADGSLSGVSLVDSFIHALNHAKDIAAEWTNEHERDAEMQAVG